MEWSALAWIGLIPLFLAVKDRSFWSAFRLGMLAGLAHYLTLVYWIEQVMRTYGYLPLYLSVPILGLLAFYLSIYPALFAALTRKISPRPWLLMILAPALWAALEYARTFAVTGFPWGLLGHSQYENLAIIQISDITGAYGVSALIVGVNSAIFLLLGSLSSKSTPSSRISIRTGYLAAGAMALIACAVFLYGHQTIKATQSVAAQAKTLEVAVIQGNIDQTIKWNPAYQADTVDIYSTLTESAATDETDLVVWPESSMPFYFLTPGSTYLSAQVLKTARLAKAFLLVGSMSYDRGQESTIFYNSAYLVDPEGVSQGKYDKVHLVPWGEYIPLKKWLSFLGKIVEQVSDFSSGETGKSLAANGKNIGVLICYEIIFPKLAREQALKGANLLVTITNDAWFGNSSAPRQHFSMAVFRAVENKRAVARAANTGISGFIGPTGRILGVTPLFKRTSLAADLPLMEITTFYTRRGDLFAGACLAIAFAALLFGFKNKE